MWTTPLRARTASALKSLPLQNRINPRPRLSRAPAASTARSWLSTQANTQHPIWLRDACPCEHCVDSSSGQKKFWTVDIPHDIQVKSRTTASDGSVEYTWSNDLPGMPADHVTRLQPDDIPRLVKDPDLSSLDRKPWTASSLSLHEVDYESYISDPTTFQHALRALHRDGLIFISSVPESETSVVNIAERIGPMRNSFYGTTWDVKSVPKAKNVAYTSGHLGFHQDLLYMANPPQLQFLHCLRSSAQGGASLFTDAYRAAVDLHAEDRGAFEDLRELKTTYHYVKDGKHYTQSRRTIEYEPEEAREGDVLAGITDINWSPPFQGPFTHLKSTEDVARWHRAASKFRAHTEAKGSVFERIMRPGDCVVFDNKRVLHARTAFAPGDAGKERWLKGCYVDGDPYWSALRQLLR